MDHDERCYENNILLKDENTMLNHGAENVESPPSVSYVTTLLETGMPAESASISRAPRVHRPPTVFEEFFIEYLFARIGRPAIQIILWDGTRIGDLAAAKRAIVIRNPRGVRRLLFGQATGFCEGIVEEDIAVEGDLVELLTAINHGLSRVRSSYRLQRRFPWHRFEHSFSASKASVQHHYDLGNEFYQLWLDSQCVYTCAYYTHPQVSLEQAQTAKLEHVCRKLRLKTGEHVVEAGSGWGALALHMARKFGVTVRAFNLSREQLEYSRARAEREGLGDRVQFIEDDYRNITGKYDAFVSVGMLEHVGQEHFRGMGQIINRILNRDGRGLIHSIGRNAACPLDTWTLKYIFPGAYAPSLREMMDLFEDGGFSVIDVENLRLHYARTCADWLARFELAADRVRQMFDDRFVRMWRLYLAASSAAFLNGDLQLFQVVFARSDNNHLPWTRDDWYPAQRENAGCTS